MKAVCARKHCVSSRVVGRFCQSHHREWVDKCNATKKSRVLLEMGKPYGHTMLLGVAHRCTTLLKEWGMLPPLDGRIRCSDCAAAAVYWDHRDYTRPFDVVPVCAACNVWRGAATGGPHPDDYLSLWNQLDPNPGVSP